VFSLGNFLPMDHASKNPLILAFPKEFCLQIQKVDSGHICAEVLEVFEVRIFLKFAYSFIFNFNAKIEKILIGCEASLVFEVESGDPGNLQPKVVPASTYNFV
jgi:hypothetical protein